MIGVGMAQLRMILVVPTVLYLTSGINWDNKTEDGQRNEMRMRIIFVGAQLFQLAVLMVIWWIIHRRDQAGLDEKLQKGERCMALLSGTWVQGRVVRVPNKDSKTREVGFESDGPVNGKIINQEFDPRVHVRRCYACPRSFSPLEVAQHRSYKTSEMGREFCEAGSTCQICGAPPADVDYSKQQITEWKTAPQHDVEIVHDEAKQFVVAAIIVLAVSAWWGTCKVMLIQSVVLPLNLLDKPLVKLILRGGDVKRPFPKAFANPLKEMYEQSGFAGAKEVQKAAKKKQKEKVSPTSAAKKKSS